MIDVHAIRKREFPVIEQLIYFNHAGVANIPQRSARAMEAFLRESAEFGSFHYDWMESVAEGARRKFAVLISASPDEVAFVKNTSEGLSIVANGIGWRRGDRIVIADIEYPANVYPWWNLRDLGVVTKMVKALDGRVSVESIEPLLAPPTRLLSVSSVQYSTGYRADLEALGRLCRDRGIYFCVDGIQSLGALPLDVERCRIDFLSADGHKWLLGPEGIGGFYCSRRVVGEIRVASVGWKSVVNPNDFDTLDFTLMPDARRFEEGTLNLLSLHGLDASLSLLLEVGVELIAERILALTDRLIEGLRARRWTIASPMAAEERSGIVAFKGSEKNASVVARCRKSSAYIVERGGYLRASPHFYNTEEEVGRLLEILGHT